MQPHIYITVKQPCSWRLTAMRNWKSETVFAFFKTKDVWVEMLNHCVPCVQSFCTFSWNVPTVLEFSVHLKCISLKWFTRDFLFFFVMAACSVLGVYIVHLHFVIHLKLEEYGSHHTVAIIFTYVVLYKSAPLCCIVVLEAWYLVPLYKCRLDEVTIKTGLRKNRSTR